MLKKLAALAALALTVLTAHARDKPVPAQALVTRPCFYELATSETAAPTIVNLNQVLHLSISEVYAPVTKPKDIYVLTVWLPLPDGASLPQVRASSPAPLIKLMREITAAADKCR